MAGAEGIATGNELPKWLASVNPPRLDAPLWLWVLVAIATYALQGFFAYRLVEEPVDLIRVLAVSALIGVMAANVLYSVVPSRRRGPRFAYAGIGWFLPPLALLQVLLHVVDPLSAWLNYL